MSDLELLDRQRAHIQSELARRGMDVEDVLQGGELTGCRYLRPWWPGECVACANERRASIYRTQADQASMYGIEP